MHKDPTQKSVTVGAILRAYDDKQIELTPHEAASLRRLKKSMRVYGKTLPPPIKHPKCDWCGKRAQSVPGTKKVRCAAHTF